jgi:hypothetical protein
VPRTNVKLRRRNHIRFITICPSIDPIRIPARTHAVWSILESRVHEALIEQGSPCKSFAKEVTRISQTLVLLLRDEKET